MPKRKKARRDARNVGQARNTTLLDASKITTKRCLCGADFQPSQSFLITPQPVLTITRVCADCADTLGNGSFAERLERANLILRRNAETEVR